MKDSTKLRRCVNVMSHDSGFPYYKSMENQVTLATKIQFGRIKHVYLNLKNLSTYQVSLQPVQ